MRKTLAIFMLSLLALPVAAVPFVPARDDDVLETLPEARSPALARLKREVASLRERPDDAARATVVARRAIAASRSSGDPRYLGQARAALAPWWSNDDLPRDVLLLRATIRQSLHEFDAALADLDRLLSLDAANVQARLTRATVRNVVGRHADAMADCDAHAGRAPPLAVAACRADTASRSGRARESLALIEACDGDARADAALRAWALTIAGEIAARLDERAAAERSFRRALALDPTDAYTLGAYADFLLDAGRARDVVALLAAHTGNDALMLRRALALRRVDTTAYAEARSELAARVDAARRRGDGVHRREEARFALGIEDDAATALALARANWRVQREPADLRILAEAARAAGDASALRAAAAWLDATGLEDARIRSLVAGGA